MDSEQSSRPVVSQEAYPGARTRLNACHSRHDFDPERGVFFCSHPQVRARQSLVTAGVCRQCRFSGQPAPKHPRPFPALAGGPRVGLCFHLREQVGLRDCPTCRGGIQLKVYACGHPDHEETTLRECQQCFDFEPRLTRGGVRSWAVGITTAPRKEPTVSRCLASLRGAGWPDVHVFAEPESILTGLPLGTRLTRRASTLGPWPNWLLALTELYLIDASRDAYFIVQDDALFCRGVRELMEAELWPNERVGLVSPYCPAPYSRTTWGFRTVDTRQGACGAVAVILPRSSVRRLLTDPQVLNHRLRGDIHGRRGIDELLGQWCHRRRLSVHYYVPSLVDHVGRESTIWGAIANTGRRASVDFVGEGFDARTLLKEDMGPANCRAINAPPIAVVPDSTFDHARSQ